MLIHLSVYPLRQGAEKVAEYLSTALFGKGEHADLGALARFSMRDVEIFSDGRSLREGTEPEYLIVRYQGSIIAVAYGTNLERQPVHFSHDDDNQRVQQIWKLLESYYS